MKVETGELSYAFAAQCFRNALATPPIYKPASTTDGNSIPASVTPHPSRSSVMSQSALAHLAYSYLCLNEPLLAMSVAKELIAMPNCTDANRYLAQSYCAEATLMQSKIHEALEYLSPTTTSSMGLSEMSEAYCRDPSVDATAARVHAQVNLATVHIAQNNFALAERYASEVIHSDPTNAKAIELLVYIMLRKRKSSKALHMITTGRAIA